MFANVRGVYFTLEEVLKLSINVEHTIDFEKYPCIQANFNSVNISSFNPELVTDTLNAIKALVQYHIRQIQKIRATDPFT